MHSELFLSCFFSFFFLQNHNLNKVYDNQNILAFWANNWAFLVIQLGCACQAERERGEKKSVCDSVREMRHGRERGNVEEYGNIKKRKEKEWELSEEFERQERSVKEGEVEQKMRQREGGLE